MGFQLLKSKDWLLSLRVMYYDRLYWRGVMLIGKTSKHVTLSSGIIVNVFSLFHGV